MPARFHEGAPSPYNPPHVNGQQTAFLPAMSNGNGYHQPMNGHVNHINVNPLPPPNSPEAIVISGISGRFPQASSMDEFAEKLFDGVDLVTDSDERFKAGLLGLPKRLGILKDIKHFDASFFSVHGKQAEVMDPQLRIMLELAYEAIMDAGVNPETIRGTKTGVFVGASTSEAENAYNAVPNPDDISGYTLTGCCRAMFSNRLSYSFDFTGPSFTIDTACSSSLLAFQRAFDAMRFGECDAAIVAGVNLCLKPQMSLNFHKLSMLSADGACKAFDKSGNGYVRSEAAVVVFLQKQQVARRVYAKVLHAKTNCDGFKTQGITYPSGEMQKQLLLDTYAEAHIDPRDVAYVEAHGTGTKVGDPQEINAITDVFCKDRDDHLMIGSVKSNMGHSEPASGLCSLAKVVIAMSKGNIPANLHFNEPNTDIPGLSDGRLEVVAKSMPLLPGSLIGVNCFGFGGANVHTILQASTEAGSESSSLLPPTVPRLLLFSGRTEKAVMDTFEALEKNPVDVPQILLLQEIFSTPVTGHSYRGYMLLGSGDTDKTVDCVPPAKRPVWFCYAGMGTQWVGMGRSLFGLPVFDKAIRKCSNALVPYGLDLYNLLLHGDETECNNMLNAFVAIAAIQVAITDTLMVMGIHPDGIFGHSVGELCCAYADGTLTAEQTVCAAYWRGRCLIEANLPQGAMASVGLSWEEAKRKCPPEISPACNNSADNVTVSGPVEAIHKFVQEMKEKGIFAKEVNSSGMAFHSRYIAAAGSQLKRALQQVIPIAKKRSSKWISSSIPEREWDTSLAQSSSAAYHVNNLLSPVLFQEALQHVPENAIVIEIAPHSLLQAILKRSLSSKSCTIIPTQKRGHEQNVNYLLANIGKLFLVGGPCAKVRNLYKTSLHDFPVRCGTNSISSLIQWDHSVEWKVPKVEEFGFTESGKQSTANFSAEISLEANSEFAYVAGHQIDGRVLFPATGYLFLAWKALAQQSGIPFDKMPVEFQEVHLHQATILTSGGGNVKFNITLLDGTGKWEICNGESLVVSGIVKIPENTNLSYGENVLKSNLPLTDDSSINNLEKKEVYRELLLRGYEYKNEFRGIEGACVHGSKGKLTWNNNWVSFLDTMLQLTLLADDSRLLKLPTRIQHMKINPVLHAELTQGINVVDAYFDKDLQVCTAGGVEIQGLKASAAPKRPPNHGPPTLEYYAHFPLTEGQKMEKESIERIFLDIVVQNSGNKLEFVHVVDGADSSTAEEYLGAQLAAKANQMPFLVNSIIATNNPVKGQTEISVGDLHTEKYDLIVMEAGMMPTEKIYNGIKPGGFLLHQNETLVDDEGDSDFHLISRCTVDEQKMSLYRKAQTLSPNPTFINVTSTSDFDWVDNIKKVLQEIQPDKSQRVWLVAENNAFSGVIGLTNCFKKEGYDRIRCLLSSGGALPDMEKLQQSFEDLLEKDLTVNVVQNIKGSWKHGTYCHYDIPQGETSKMVTHAYLNAIVRGDLSSLSWVESPLGSTTIAQENQVLCNVYSAPLNFRDIMLATGKLPPDAIPGNLVNQECLLGLEFAGQVAATGVRVMGMVPAQGLATTVLADKNFMWKVPKSWTMKEASTIPVAYSTAYYALIVRGQLKSGESVLIHAGSGGVGQAAIQIALSMGCQVYTTVGTSSKREFLKERFPSLNDSNIGTSRNAVEFETWLMKETHGRGVDVALNSLAGDKLKATVRCLAQHGRFLEIGKFDLSEDTPLGMSVFLKNVTFHGILLDALFDVPEEKKRVVDLVQQGLNSGVVIPLPVSSFDQSEAEVAFRYMSGGKHIGKVVLEIRMEDESIKVAKEVAAKPRLYCQPDSVYIITGGLGGFGLEMSQWLAARGAKNIVLTSRSGIRTGFQKRAVKNLEGQGVKVVISTDDITEKAGAKKLIETCQKIGSIKGIFHLAVVIKDGMIENLTANDFKKVYDPKALGFIHLDEITREKRLDLDWFVAFSSVSCGRGNMGQTNYGLANSVLERVCEKRKADGLAGLAIQWGAIGDVGVVLELLGDNDTIVGGSVPQRMVSCLQTMETLMCNSRSVTSPAVVASTVWAKKDGSNAKRGDGKINVCQIIAKIIGISNVAGINKRTTLGDLGMDSLMSVEVRQALERECDITLSATEVQNLTFEHLEEMQDKNKPEVTEQPAAVEGPKVAIRMTKTLAIQDLLDKKPVIEFVPESSSKNKQPVFLLPPIEGSVAALADLIKSIDCPVFAFQASADAQATSLPKIAEQYIKLMKTYQPSGPYKIVGYSFGAAVAFEMALQLGSNQVPELILIDGSHAYVSQLVRRYISRLDDPVEWQASQIIAFLSQFAEFSVDQLRLALLAEQSWDKMLAYFKNILTSVGVKSSVEQLEKILESFATRVLAGMNYQPKTKYAGHVHLLKAATNLAKSQLADDYSLSEVCENAVRVIEIFGDHVSCVSSLSSKNAFKIQEAVNHSHSIYSNGC